MTTQTRWYKLAKPATKFTKAAPAKSMLANDFPGYEKAMEKDGWLSERPDDWVEPKLEQSEAEILKEAFSEIDILKKAGDLLSAENETLKKQLAKAQKKSGKAV